MPERSDFEVVRRALDSVEDYDDGLDALTRLSERMEKLERGLRLFEKAVQEEGRRHRGLPGTSWCLIFHKDEADVILAALADDAEEEK